MSAVSAAVAPSSGSFWCTLAPTYRAIGHGVMRPGASNVKQKRNLVEELQQRLVNKCCLERGSCAHFKCSRRKNPISMVWIHLNFKAGLFLPRHPMICPKSWWVSTLGSKSLGRPRNNRLWWRYPTISWFAKIRPRICRPAGAFKHFLHWRCKWVVEVMHEIIPKCLVMRIVYLLLNIPIIFCVLMTLTIIVA